MRGLVHVITTSSSDRKIPLVTSKGAAAWVEEEAAIPESDDGFGQITLSAHKVGSMIRISEELLRDSAFDLAAYITGEFARRVSAAEEAAILAGDGSHKPTGLLHDTLGAETGVTAAAAAAITADELIDLQHSLKSGEAYVLPAASAEALGGVKATANQSDSVAATIAELKTDLNALLAKLKVAGVMISDPETPEP